MAEKEKRDPYRLYVQGIGGVPDGYFDTISAHQAEWIKRQYPGVYEALEKQANEVAASKPKKKAKAGDEQAPDISTSTKEPEVEGEKEG
ncbi:MAG TPA: hypothetical protein VIY48_11995 [Candidatus Paceibacterota bacterium]